MKIIGQDKLLGFIYTLINNDKFPKFSIICGKRSSGKKLIVRRINKDLGTTLVEINKDVKSVREMVNSANNVNDKILYYLNDINNMHPNAINSLLKVIEEPRKNVYFITTVNSLNSVLGTIKNRAVVLTLEPYTTTVLENYAKKVKPDITTEELIKLLIFCKTIGKIEEAVTFNFIELYDYVKLILENLNKSSGVNTLKVVSKLKFKETDVGFSPEMFLNCMLYQLSNKILMGLDKTEKGDKYLHDMLANLIKMNDAINLIYECFETLNTKSINKSAVFDKFMLDLRDIIMSKS